MAAQSGKGLTEAVCTTTIPPQFFEALVRDNSDMISVIDMAGRFVFISEAATRILGLKIEDWIGRDGFDLIHPDDIGVAAESLATTVASESGVREPLLLRLRHADGSWKDVEINKVSEGYEMVADYEVESQFLYNVYLLVKFDKTVLVTQ